jgi:hypothetical protein
LRNPTPLFAEGLPERVSGVGVTASRDVDAVGEGAAARLGHDGLPHARTAAGFIPRRLLFTVADEKNILPERSGSAPPTQAGQREGCATARHHGDGRWLRNNLEIVEIANGRNVPYLRQDARQLAISCRTVTSPENSRLCGLMRAYSGFQNL